MPEQDTERALAVVRGALAEHPDASVRPHPDGPPGTIRVSLWDEDPTGQDQRRRWFDEQYVLAAPLEDGGLLIDMPPGSRHILVTVPIREVVVYGTAEATGVLWHRLASALYTRCGHRTHVVASRESLPDEQVCEPCRTGPVMPPRPEYRNLL